MAAASAPSSSCAAFSHINIPKHYLSQNQRSSCRSMATQTSKLISHYKLSITSSLYNSQAPTNPPSSSSAPSLVSSSSSPGSVHQQQDLATQTRSASKAGAVQEMYVYELNESDRNSPAYLPFSLKFDFSKGLPTGAIGDLIPLTNKVLKKFGVEKFEPVGEQFDPNSHLALFEVPDPSKEPGTVAIVAKVGYMLHDRVLRPAEVGVVKSLE